MKNKLYTATVPITVWVETGVRATDPKEAMIEASDKEFELAQIGKRALDTGSSYFHIVSVEDPDYDRMQIEPMEELP